MGTYSLNCRATLYCQPPRQGYWRQDLPQRAVLLIKQGPDQRDHQVWRRGEQTGSAVGVSQTIAPDAVVLIVSTEPFRCQVVLQQVGDGGACLWSGISLMFRVWIVFPRLLLIVMPPLLA